jgi:hypothetical protein
MAEITRSLIARVGVDLSKRVVQVHAVDRAGRVVLARPMSVERFFAWCAELPAGCLVVSGLPIIPSCGRRIFPTHQRQGANDGRGSSTGSSSRMRVAQPGAQARGVGFPLARLVAVICLATGTVHDAALGPHSGKGSGELGLVRRLLAVFSLAMSCSPMLCTATTSSSPR